jgi:SNF2 family DNA or RNA helicase
MLKYQHKLHQHLEAVPKSALFADMGLGKTVSTLTGLKHLLHQFEISKVLLVAPLRVARKVWTDELDEWSHLAGQFRVAKILGSPAARVAAIETEADIYLINRENFAWLVDLYWPASHKEPLQPWPWDTLVVDESSSFKNQSSKRWQAWLRIRSLIDRTILLSGTPTPHGLMDLWSQVFMLDGGARLGKSQSAFQQRWFQYVVPRPQARYGKWVPQPHAEQQIYELIADICISLRAEDYLDLPETVYNWIRVELSPRELKSYKRLQRESVLALPDGVITAVNAGILAGKLLQLANGAAYTAEYPEWATLHDKKLEALEEILDTCPDRIMIMYSFKSDIARIEAMFARAFKKKSWRKLNTETDEDDWNAGKIDWLLLHPKSAGHGLNLQHGGSTIVWFGLPWSLEFYLQANARIIGGHRATGKHPVIHHIVAEDTYDMVVQLTLKEREVTQDRLMHALSIFTDELLDETGLGE